MIKHDVQQSSSEWLAVRAGIATASESDSLITPAKLQRSAASEEGGAYFCRKLAEKWIGMPLEDKGASKAMDNGTVLEEHAIPKFELETGLDVAMEDEGERWKGFLTTDDGRFGSSPDAMLDTSPISVGCEIKSPEVQTHVKWLMAGVLPPEHRGQVQASMLVTGSDHWWFMSYCPRLPELIIKVPRDEKYIAALRAALEQFNADIDAGFAKLLKLNNGVMPYRAPKEDLIEQHYATSPAPTDADFLAWLNTPGMKD